LIVWNKSWQQPSLAVRRLVFSSSFSAATLQWTKTLITTITTNDATTRTHSYHNVVRTAIPRATMQTEDFLIVQVASGYYCRWKASVAAVLMKWGSFRCLQNHFLPPES